MPSLKTGLSMLLGAGLLLGCAVATPPAQHELMSLALGEKQLPERWKNTQSPGTFDEQALGFAPDPALKTLISEALQYNSDLRIAAARVDQARAALKAAGGPLLPALGVGLQTGDSTLPTSSMSVTGVGLVMNWEVDLWGRLRSEQAGSDARYQSAALDRQYSQQAIAAAVIRAWLGATEATLQLELSRDMARIADKQLQLMKVGQKVGRNTAQDVVLSQAALAVYQNQLAGNELMLDQVKRALEVLLGRYPAAEVTTAGRFPVAQFTLPAGLPAELMSRRPDILAAEQRFRAAFQDQEVAKRARLPSLKLTGGVAYIEDTNIMLKSGIDNPLWGLSGQLLAPIFTGGQLEAQLEAKTAKQQEAIAQYSKAALIAFNEVEGALATERALSKRQNALQMQSDQLKKSFEFAQIQKRVGKGDQYQLLQQQLNWLGAQAGGLRVSSDRLANRVNLHQALGGHFSS